MMTRSLLLLALVAVLVAALAPAGSLAVSQQPRRAAGNAASMQPMPAFSAATAAKPRGRAPAAGAAPNARPARAAAGAGAARSAGRVVEDPALLQPRRASGTFDKNSLAAIHLKPSARVDASANNWRAPIRKYRLTELARKANGAHNTKASSRVGPRKPSSRSKVVSTVSRAGKGAPPRPTGARGKFNPRTARVNPFGKVGASSASVPQNQRATRSNANPNPRRPKSNRSNARATMLMETESSAVMAAEAEAQASSAVLAEANEQVEIDMNSDAETEGETELDAEAVAEGEVESIIDDVRRAEAEEAQHEARPVVAATHKLRMSPGQQRVSSAGHWKKPRIEEGTRSSDSDMSMLEVSAALQAGDLKLPSGKVLTAAQIAAITAAFATQPSARVYYHWSNYQSGIRWGRNRKIEKGEIDWMNTQNSGMAAGGGYYLAEDPKASYGYGPVPCYITTPAGALVMGEDQKPIVSVLGSALSNEDKAILGGVIPFVHQYRKANGWWVTHHPNMLSNIRCGNAIITPDPLGSKPALLPQVNVDNYADIRRSGVMPADSRFVQVHFDQMNGQVVKERQLVTQFDAHSYLLNMMSEQWDSDNAALGQDVKNAASWVNSFFVLMQYIDGLSLVRAKKVAPSDPWSVFEPQRFGPFLDTFNKYIKMREAGQQLGIGSNNKFGNGEGKDAWAAKMVDQVMPQIYADLSAGGEMSLRTESVRAGGPEHQDPNNVWTTGYFISTHGQTVTMQQNKYLSVESQAYSAGGDPNLELVAYYYPDPLRYAGVADRITPTLKAAITAAGDYTAAGGADLLKAHTKQMMHELLINMFQGLYGQSICSGTDNFQGALKSALQLVSIHPCSDFNGRSTRFFMYMAALEGCGIVPVSFMSDFDIVTQFSTYNSFMNNAQVGYTQLKVAMISELISSLANNVVARQYDLPEWAAFLKTSMAHFGQHDFKTELSDEENDMVRTRQFVPLIDRWFGKSWPGRNQA